MVDGIVCYYIAFLLYGLYANWKAGTPSLINMSGLVLELPILGRLLELW